VRVREAEKLLCTWREACKAADYVLEHFGNKSRDRGIWIWYCRRIGLDVFLDIADEVISSARQGELRWPGPQDLQREKIMKCLKIGDRMYRKYISSVPKYLV